MLSRPCRPNAAAATAADRERRLVLICDAATAAAAIETATLSQRTCFLPWRGQICSYLPALLLLPLVAACVPTRFVCTIMAPYREASSSCHIRLRLGWH